MTVYVDSYAAGVPQKWRGGGHLVADTHEELERFARLIGLESRWIQRRGTPLEHYDLTAWKKRAAIRNGAIEITSREMGRITMARIDAQTGREVQREDHQLRLDY